MTLTAAQITKLTGLIALHVDAQVEKADVDGEPSEDAADCRLYADIAKAKLTKYIDGLAVIPRLKGIPA